MNGQNRMVMALALALTVLGGCATGAARVGQFESLARAGIAFGEAIPAVLDEAFDAAVTTDSLVLTQARPGLNRQERLAAIGDSGKALSERLAILDSLKRHAGVLRSYFLALQALAQTTAGSSGLTAATDGLVGELGALHPRIAGARIGNLPIGDVTGPVVELALGAYQNAVLEGELRRNGPAIRRELELQERALRVIADQMKADLEAVHAAQDRDAIVLPFVRDGTLPADWAGRRAESLRRRVAFKSVDAAAAAAANLRQSFVAVAEDRFGEVQLAALISDVNRLLGFVERTRAGK